MGPSVCEQIHCSPRNGEQYANVRGGVNAKAGGGQYNRSPMARSWQYPRWRRMLMQGVLCVVLVATVGLAEWVTRARQRTSWGGLKQSVVNERLRIALPARWTVRPQTDANKTTRTIEMN